MSQKTANNSNNSNGPIAIVITQSNAGKQAEKDLKDLLQVSAKSNQIQLYVLENVNATCIQEGIKSLGLQVWQSENTETAIAPVQLPLKNDVDVLVKWLQQASKNLNEQNLVAAYGKPSAKNNFFDKHLSYWSNFWPKLMSGANANMSSMEAVLMNKTDFTQLVIDQKINNPWLLASLAEKAEACTKIPFEYQSNDFVLGDVSKSFFQSFTLGFKAIWAQFFKTVRFKNSSSNWTDINHKMYQRTFGILALLLLIGMAWMSPDYNITWDEPNHNTFSKDVLTYYSSLGNDTTMFDFQKAGHRDYFTNVYYGMSIDVLAAGINDVIGAKNDFYARHLLNALVGFLCILFTALLVRLFSGWLPAIVALIAMVCSPSFFGHCFNNPKDIPFATGFIMAIYYLMRLMKELPNARHQTKVMLAIAIGFALSIRAGGIMLFAFLALGIGLHWLFFRKKQLDFTKGLLPYLKAFVIIGIAGYAIGILMWPYALRQPLTGALTALKEFEKFSFLTYYELFEGQRIFNKPWYYEPKLIAITAPLAVLAGFGLSLLLAWFKKSKLELSMVLVLGFVTIAPAAYAIYKGSYVYNGWRHFIFVYPSLLALAILGWYWLSQFFGQRIQVILFCLIGLSFSKPAIWSIKNHPYEYLYFNELVGGIQGANGQYELDYWNQTPRAAFEWLIKNRPEVLSGDVKVSSNNIQEALKTFVPDGDSVKYAWTREYEWANNNWKYAIWTTRTLSKNQILGGYWPPKGTIYEVKVDGVTVAAVVEANNDFSYMGKTYLNKNKGDSALLFYQKAFAYNPLEEEYARGIADAYKMKMQLDSSIIFYKKAIELRDGNYEAYQSLGEVLYTKAVMANQQNPDKKIIDEAFEQLGLAFKHKKNASAPLLMGEIRLLQNNPAEAKGYFNQFLQVYGNVGRGYLGLGKSQLLLGEQDSAFYNLQAAIQLEPKNPEAYYYLGTELQKSGRKQEAEQILSEYAKLTGSNLIQ